MRVSLFGMNYDERINTHDDDDMTSPVPIGMLLHNTAQTQRTACDAFIRRGLDFIDADDQFWAYCYRALTAYAARGLFRPPVPFLSIRCYFDGIALLTVAKEMRIERLCLSMMIPLGEGEFISTDLHACSDFERMIYGNDDASPPTWCSHNVREHQWTAVLFALLTDEDGFRAAFFEHAQTKHMLRFSVHSDVSTKTMGAQRRFPHPDSILLNVAW